MISFSISALNAVEKNHGKTKIDHLSLCLAETLHLHFGDVRYVNKTSEFINQCRHQNKLLLSLKRNATNTKYLYAFK